MASDPLPTPQDLAPLAVRLRKAAPILGISERTLWAMTAPRGPIPVVRIGSTVLYPVAALKAWLDAEAAKGVER